MPLSCLACRTIFTNVELHKQHYQSEWHRYNLKRKVLEMEPVTQEQFEIKRMAADAQATASKKGEIVSKEAFDSTSQQLRCTLCSKSFQSTKTLNNHLKSNKHIANEKQVSDNDKVVSSSRSSISSELSAHINTTSDCVTLVKKPERVGSQSSDNKHISSANDDDWSSDDDDFGSDDEWEDMDVDGEEDEIERLKKEFNFKKCLFCLSDKYSDSLEECLKHMSTCHTFFIPYDHLLADAEGLLCYLHHKVETLRRCIFCGKRSKRGGLAVKQHMDQKGHKRMAYDTPEQFLEYVHFYDEPEDETEDPTGAKLEGILASVLENDYCLMLPSGAVIGNRALKRYYKQRPRMIDENRARTRNVVESSRRYIATTPNNASASNSIQLSKNFIPLRELKVIQKSRNKYWDKVKLKQNDMKTHSRNQYFWSMRY